ncbi:MAG TPA: transporter substrate-binding domain-containing protein [Candidatus Merdenecus merdavium]|nr:transporter substrate-binding domain-containing protein [Candidatus Merdenecus merdavium]
MKKILAIAAILTLTFSLVACGGTEDAESTETKNESSQESNKEDKKAEDKDSSGSDLLIVGTEAGFAPYEYLKGDTVAGVDMDICQAIADAMGKELKIENMQFQGALLAVQQGKIDLVAAGVSITDERKEQMDFSENYIDATEVIVVNKENPAVSEPTGEKLKDLVVGVQTGNTADLWVSDTENAQPKEIKRYNQFLQASEDLKNNKIDCIVMDEMPAQELVAASDGTLEIVEGDPLFVEQYAIAVQKGNQELLDQINEVIKQLKEDGKIEEFLLNHTQQQ